MSDNDLRQPLSKKRSVLYESEPMQIYYNVQIKAKVKKQVKTILHPQTGIFPPNSFTAILGTSGSGKTTLLNFLAGRLMSDNLTITGEYKLNSVSLTSIDKYCKEIGYVMQQDSLLAMLTPKQCLMFAAGLRLPFTKQKTQQLVNDLLQQLGLIGCSDVRVGNNFFKGISGGQRKRTSIGVQLITNPSLIFLDEPTTGLDSTTALQVILLLKKLSEKGKTVISTIHQPSSQLFCQFDRLLLLTQGRCIYQGDAKMSQGYFEQLGYKCPQFMNASQFYLDLMNLTIQENGQANYEQEKQKHSQKMKFFQQKYKSSKFAQFQPDSSLNPIQPNAANQVSIFMHFYLILIRSFIITLRNPMDVVLKLIQAVFTALISFAIFGRIDNSDSQNLRGVLFFIASSNVFGGIQSTLATFAGEKNVFLRERFSKSYSTFTYFIARTLCIFPFDLMYPAIGLAIIYWTTGLGHETFDEFWKLIVSVNTMYFLSASYGLFYAALIPKLQTALALVPVLIVPFMLLGGFFINLDDYNDIRVIFYPIMYLSPFKYGFQSQMIIVSQDHPTYRPNDLWINWLIMIGMGIILRFISSIVMQIISNPKRVKIKINN